LNLKLLQRAARATLLLTSIAIVGGCGGGSGSATAPGQDPRTVTVPLVATPPASITVLEGEPVTFSVALNGPADFGCQWFRGGAAIVGATTLTYTIPSTVFGDDGAQFSVVCGGSTGSVAPPAATLAVTAVVPRITTQPKSVAVADGQPVTFSVRGGSTNLHTAISGNSAFRKRA
jgi:hypothetical protein